MNVKKLVERNQLLSLLKCLELEHLKPEDTESPDFLIPSGTRKIGVEVTRLVSTRAPNQDNPSQASRVLDDLVGRIFAQYTQLGGPPVNASLKFRDGLRVARGDIAPFAKDLAVLLADRIGQDHAHQPPPQSIEFSLDLHGLLCVGAWPVLAGSSPYWHRDVSGMVDTAQREDILATLAGKESKIESYRLHAEEIWLLIVCDFMANGLFIDPPVEPVAFAIDSVFDRIFCLAWTGTYAVELPLLRAAG
jgi:hypothetical protein